MNSIYILTGEIKSGKTTRLQKFIDENSNCDGIIAPEIDGYRNLVRIKSGETKLLEYLGGVPYPALTLKCNYKFLDSVFEWGMNELYSAYKQNPGWLIIDEIGPLELECKALDPMVSRILNEDSNNSNIILVVRKNMLEEVIEHYNLHKKGYKFINK
ncbi:MAG: hypothetical protein HY959_00285 [Ignavibacteriae bacterium]|nr:hypothetical protein [Ignavibacteriota bacterium]